MIHGSFVIGDVAFVMIFGNGVEGKENVHGIVCYSIIQILEVCREYACIIEDVHVDYIIEQLKAEEFAELSDTQPTVIKGIAARWLLKQYTMFLEKERICRAAVDWEQFAAHIFLFQIPHGQMPVGYDADAVIGVRDIYDHYLIHIVYSREQIMAVIFDTTLPPGSLEYYTHMVSMSSLPMHSSREPVFIGTTPEEHHVAEALARMTIINRLVQNKNGAYV